jgi:hypothetical protein
MPRKSKLADILQHSVHQEQSLEQATVPAREQCLPLVVLVSAAQGARWAKVKGQVVSITTRRRRKLSATALAKIRAAQKARWGRMA